MPWHGKLKANASVSLLLRRSRVCGVLIRRSLTASRDTHTFTKPIKPPANPLIQGERGEFMVWCGVAWRGVDYFRAVVSWVRKIRTRTLRHTTLQTPKPPSSWQDQTGLPHACDTSYRIARGIDKISTDEVREGGVQKRLPMVNIPRSLPPNTNNVVRIRGSMHEECFCQSFAARGCHDLVRPMFCRRFIGRTKEGNKKDNVPQQTQQKVYLYLPKP